MSATSTLIEIVVGKLSAIMIDRIFLFYVLGMLNGMTLRSTSLLCSLRLPLKPIPATKIPTLTSRQRGRAIPNLARPILFETIRSPSPSARSRTPAFPQLLKPIRKLKPSSTTCMSDLATFHLLKSSKAHAMASFPAI